MDKAGNSFVAGIGVGVSDVRPPSEFTREALLAAFACAVCMGLSFAPVFMGTFPLFLEPVSREFNWSASIFPQAMLISGVAGALCGPLVGRLIDSLGVRKVLLPGLVAWAGSLLCMSFLDGNVVTLWVLSAIMGVLAAACGPVALAKVISSWFDRSRGIALSAVLGGSVAVFTAILLFVARSLILSLGWRGVYTAFACLVVIIALPLAFLFLRERAGKTAESAMDMPPPAGVDVRAGAAFGSRAFATVMGASMLVCASASGVTSHLLPWGGEWSLTAQTATFALTLYSLAGPFSALLAGAAADRLPKPNLLAIVFAVPLSGFLVMLTGTPLAVLFGLTMLGAGFAAVAGLLPFFTTRYFGLASASTIFGVAIGLTTLSLGLGPVVLGLLRDHFGSYHAGGMVVAGALVIAVLLAATLPRYPRVDAS